MTELRQHAPGTSTPAETDARFGRVAAILEQAQRQIYLSLPTEEQLQLEIERERRLIESAREDGSYE